MGIILSNLIYFKIVMTIGFITWTNGCGFYSEKFQKDIPIIESDSSKIDYSIVHQTVFSPNCISCHGSSGGVNLESYENVKKNLQRIEKAALTDKTMPKSGPLGKTEAGLLKNWIQEGAPETATATRAVSPSPLPSRPSSSPPTPAPRLDPLHATYERVREKIFIPHCISCHGRAGGVSLESLDSIKKELNRITIATLVDKTMPQGGFLSKDEILLLTEWIENGAQNN